MKPEDVNQKDFVLEKILFNNGEGEGGFSIASGKFRGDVCLVIRWNGKENQLGFPIMGDYESGTPVWFIIPKMLNEAILRSLVEKGGVNLGNILGELKNIKS